MILPGSELSRPEYFTSRNLQSEIGSLRDRHSGNEAMNGGKA
jgi:hypothetical protein